VQLLAEDFLRPGAATQFVMITDDDDNVAPEAFRTQMEAMLGHGFIQHAIASEDVMGAPCISEVGAMNNPLCMAVIPGLGGIPALCGAVAIGRTYYSLADQTGGKTMSICKGDWSDVFAELKAAVIDAVPLPCDYPLESASDPRFDPEQVKIEYRNEAGMEEFPRAPNEAACGDNRAWFYDDPAKPTTIRLCPTSCGLVEQGGSVDVAFGCPPIVII